MNEIILIKIILYRISRITNKNIRLIEYIDTFYGEQVTIMEVKQVQIMKRIFSISVIILAFITLNYSLMADNYKLEGRQSSIIEYRLYQNIVPTSETVTMNLSYVIPEIYESITYSQYIYDFKVTFTIEPEEKN